MALLDLVLDIFLAFVLIIGSTSLGYLFLRAGWHKIRILDRSYKIGWSVILGAIFSIAVVAIAFALSVMPFLFFGFRGFLFLCLIAMSVSAAVVLTARRKLFARKRVTVSIPKRVVGAKIASDKAMQKVEETGLIRVAKLDEEKLDAMRKKLAEEKKKKPVGRAAEEKKRGKPVTKPLERKGPGPVKPVKGKPEKKEIAKPGAVGRPVAEKEIAGIETKEKVKEVPGEKKTTGPKAKEKLGAMLGKKEIPKAAVGEKETPGAEIKEKLGIKPAPKPVAGAKPEIGWGEEAAVKEAAKPKEEKPAADLLKNLMKKKEKEIKLIKEKRGIAGAVEKPRAKPAPKPKAEKQPDIGWKEEMAGGKAAIKKEEGKKAEQLKKMISKEGKGEIEEVKEIGEEIEEIGTELEKKGAKDKKKKVLDDLKRRLGE